MADQKYRWPQKGDRLLRSSDDFDQGVEFVQEHTSRHVFIWNGYLDAGDALVRVCEQDPHQRSLLIYPILFNYRHGIELAMKWVIGHYGRHVGITLPDKLDHDLWKLWTLCKRVILEIGGEEDPATAVVEQIIKDFHDLDKSATAFRYALNRNGALVNLPDGLIDVANIRDVVQSVSNYFDGADGLLDNNVRAADQSF